MPAIEAFVPYEFAARRKLEIARYHQCELEKWRASDPVAEDVPVVELQAHFEGAIRAMVSIADQIASGLVAALDGLDFNLPKLRHASFKGVVKKLPNSDEKQWLVDWFQTPIARDVWAVRNSSSHRYYEKKQRGNEWEVAVPLHGTGYEGSRGVCDYVALTVDHAESLVERIPGIREFIEGITA